MALIILKLGGDVVQGPYMDAIAADDAALTREGRRAVIVHGGGPQATDLQKRIGQTPQIVAGRRITDDAALDVMKMTVAGKVNVDLCAKLHGARPIGLHTAISAEKRPPKVLAGAGKDPIDLGHVGDVTGIDRALLTLLLDSGYVPVLACLGQSDGRVYNINADTVANRVATLLAADALVLVTDVPGVLRDVSDPSSRIARLTKAESSRAIETGLITKVMIPKVEEAFAAIAEGVKSVVIVGRLSPGELARAVREPGSVGTVLSA
jgi:acetylglutamate kinase